MGSGVSREDEIITEGHSAPPSARTSAAGFGTPRRSLTATYPHDISKSSLHTAGGPSRSFFESTNRITEGEEEPLITVTRTGFSAQNVTIHAGQFVVFQWGEDIGTNTDIVQVVHDGEKLRPVIGGFSGSSSRGRSHYEQLFTMEGEYKFALSGIRCTPLSVTVKRRMDCVSEINDNGFTTEIIYIDQGQSVKWTWQNCNVPHSVQEVTFNSSKGCFFKKSSPGTVVRTVTGTNRQTFSRPGLFYFQTESGELGRPHLCIVHVRESQREHKVDVLDRSFQPMIILIEEGDRVWWSWDKSKCNKPHSIYQIEAPPIDLGENEPYLPVKTGFRWSQPSKQGLLSHEFLKAGVYYFSDQNYEEAAEYIGTVIVKPKQQEHYIELTEDGFSQDFVNAQSGDRIWWTWNDLAAASFKNAFTIIESDSTLNPSTARPTTPEDEEKISPDKEALKLMASTGLATAQLSTIGVYNFRLSNSPNIINTCSVIVNPGSKNHTIHLTDNGFEPQVVTVRPNDRVWWVWQGGKKQHNISQVTHQGLRINNGFCSGALRDPPSAFSYQFITPGVYYFVSANLPKMFGAIVVATQPQVHEVHVSSNEIKPDPLTVQINDVVCWIFRGLRTYDVSEIEGVDQLLDAEFSNKEVTPRRCLSKAINKIGVFHFSSKSFSKQKKEKVNYVPETRLSSVVSSERYDHPVIRVSKLGFSPDVMYLQKGQSVLWTWKGTEEPHNIIHVNSPDAEDAPLSVIQGPRSFHSGKPVANNSFLYTFDEAGSYTVATQGGPGYSCTIHILDIANYAAEPFIKSEVSGGTVDRMTRIELDCKTPNAKIYYTTDGTLPELHTGLVKLYNPSKGVILKKSGLNFIRAIAVAPGFLQSHVFTSKRFWVLTQGSGEDYDSDESAEKKAIQPKPLESPRHKTQTGVWEWWNCVPTIKACYTEPGVIEIFWDPPPEEARKMIKGYQIYLNGVSYIDPFPNTSLRVSGLSGGRTYEIQAEVYPKDKSQTPQKSNKLKLTTPIKVPQGGPLISVERGDNNDVLTVVWMSIDTPSHPVDGYHVFLNGEQCGPKLVPELDSNRCKVVVSSCELGKLYKIYVLAVLKKEDGTLRSNTLDIILPLDASQITLPPESDRLPDNDLYKEFVQFHEGSGYIPDPEAEKHIPNAKGEELEDDTDMPGSGPQIVEVEAKGHPEKTLMFQPGYSIETSDQGNNTGFLLNLGKYDPFDRKVNLGKTHTDSAVRRNSFVNKSRSAVVNEDIVVKSLPLKPKVKQQSHMEKEVVPLLKRFSFFSVVKCLCIFLRVNKKMQDMIAPLSGGSGKLVINWDQFRAFYKSHYAMMSDALRINANDRGRALMNIPMVNREVKPLGKDADKGRIQEHKTTLSRQSSLQSVTSKSHRNQYHRQSSTSHITDRGSMVDETQKIMTANSHYTVHQQSAVVDTPVSGHHMTSRVKPRYVESDASSSIKSFGRNIQKESKRLSQNYPAKYTSEQNVNLQDRQNPSSYQYPTNHKENAYVHHQDMNTYMYNALQEAKKNYIQNMVPGLGGIHNEPNKIYRMPLEDQAPYNIPQRLDNNQVRRDIYVEHIPVDYDYSTKRFANPQNEIRSGQPDAFSKYLDYDDTVFQGQNRGITRDDSVSTSRTKNSRQLSSHHQRKSFEIKRRHDVVSIPESDRVVVLEDDDTGDGKDDESFSQTGNTFDDASDSDFDSLGHNVDFIHDFENRSACSDFHERHIVVNAGANNFHYVRDNERNVRDLQAYNNVDHRGRGENVHEEKGKMQKSPRQHRKEPSTSSSSGSSSSSSSDSSADSEADENLYTVHDRCVVMDARRPDDAYVKQTKKKFIPNRPRSPITPRRDGEKNVLLLESKKTKHIPHPPDGPKGKGNWNRRKKKSGAAIIEVQDAVEIDAHQRSSPDRKIERLQKGGRENMHTVNEGQYIISDGDGILPSPSISVETKGKSGVRVLWALPKQPDPDYKLLLYNVNVVGSQFLSDINSDISFECNLVEKGDQVRGVQHCWNVQPDNTKCNIKGLVPGLTYRIYVIANYTMLHGEKPCEIQTTSSVIYYTTVGPPGAPSVKVIGVDLYQATLEWSPPKMHQDLKIKGYQIYIDHKKLGGLKGKDVREMVINNLEPGKTIVVAIQAVARQGNLEGDMSRNIYISCPQHPPTPTVSQQPSYKRGSVLIAWDKPHHSVNTNEEAISLYWIYVDEKWFGEVKENKMSNKQGYQYVLTSLPPEECVYVTVKAIAGNRRFDPESSHVYCLSDSVKSNSVPVQSPEAPRSPKLRLEGLHPEGIDVTWQAPQQFGDAIISGYQMLKNGKLYGSIIPPDVCSLQIRDVSLGEKVALQLIALTEHPVGKSGDGSTGTSGDRDSGIAEDRPSEILLGEKYAGCRPGPKLIVHYTGLVQSPKKVWCEKVTGHSALIVWSKKREMRQAMEIQDLRVHRQTEKLPVNYGEESKQHFVRPESYQVTWWPGDMPREDINSDSTTDDHLLIHNLRPATTYTVVVEARKMEKYTDIDEDQDQLIGHETVNAFILNAKSDQITVRSASPPEPPSNLGIQTTTCNSLTVAWDPPRIHGVDILAIRVDCISLNTGDPHTVSIDVMPDATSTEIHNLREKTDYMIRLTSITDEYFDQLPDKDKTKKARVLPKDAIIAPDQSVWLPNSSILAKTSGTEAPTNLKIKRASKTSLTITWTPPLVYGSNKLTGQIVRWADVRRARKKDEDMIVASHVNLLPTEDMLKIDDLVPGSHYKIVVEAIVSVKTALEKDRSDSGIEKYRRTAHIMSKPLYARTRAPTEPPKVYITHYTQSTAHLYWEKPMLLSVVGKDEDGKPKYLRRYLEGYRLEIDGKAYLYLGPNAQSATITKCKPGKTYNIVLVALTCTEEGKKERKQKFKGFYKTKDENFNDYAAILTDEENLDSSPSDSLEVTLPRHQEGYLESLSATFIHDEDRDNKTFGDIEISWTTQGSADVLRQFCVLWFNVEDKVVQTKYIAPDKRKCRVPVTKNKCVYDITVEPSYFTEVLPFSPQKVQVVIPGPPDAPEIFLKSLDDDEFIIEWGEPRLWGGVKVKGYQVYLNDKKGGLPLGSRDRKAVIPCRPNRTYRTSLVALSADPEYNDSPKSTTLLVSTSSGTPRPSSPDPVEDDAVPVKVTCVTETSIHLDWSKYMESEDVSFYKIQWSSVAQPSEREVKCSAKDSNCVINKCLPGTTHFVRVSVYDKAGHLIDKGRQLTVQTSAPPDSPVLSIRACNFRYIAIQWEKPNSYGDAHITGYKVYVNGIVEALLNADEHSFTFTRGKWCHEYSFQVQALTAQDRLHGKPSEPLVMSWPGIRGPAIYRIPTATASAVRVGWDEPYSTDGVKVKHFRLCCSEEDSGKVIQSIGPIHPETRQAEFQHLKRGNYIIYLEVHLHGTSDIIRSDPIKMCPSISPDPPHITVTVVGLEERRQIEKITCDLVNKRDRIIREIGHKLKRIGALSHPEKAEGDQELIHEAQTLTRVEELLELCFAALEKFTGHIIAHVSWTCIQANPDLQLSGFKVLVDGKQYGNVLHPGVKSIKVKLGTDQEMYKLSMVSMTNVPEASSEESNVVDLIAAAFRPFAFYCYHAIHNKFAGWPAKGCCRYDDSIAYERQLAKKLANQGLLQKNIPPPDCSLLDIFDGEFKPLLHSHKAGIPTVILFWTPWCLSSQRIMSHFIRFARENASEYNFIAITCGEASITAGDRKELIHTITSNSWREDNVWHCTSQCKTSIYEATRKGSPMRFNDSVEDKQLDITDLLGIAGIPTFLFVHPEGYLKWHGRYCAFDFATFSAFMRYTFSEVVGSPYSVYELDGFQTDTTLSDSEYDYIKYLLTTGSYKVPPPSSNRELTDRIFLIRQVSPRSQKKKRKQKLSINKRPYSASGAIQLTESPYMQKLTPSYKVKKLLIKPRPQSAKKCKYFTTV